MCYEEDEWYEEYDESDFWDDDNPPDEEGYMDDGEYVLFDDDDLQLNVTPPHPTEDEQL